MASVRTVWGIDVGRCALKAIKLRVGTDGKVELVAHDYVEHAKILSQPDADRHELITAALEKFLSRNDISKDQVVVSVPGQHTLARFSKLPPVAPKRIPDIVRYEADQQIPFDMDEVIWDYQTFQEEGLPDIEVGIFAMKRELIKEHLLHFEQASIEPIGVQSGPLAVYNAAHFDGLLSKETTILLDIGAEGTDLIIATPSRLWTRAIPIGGNSFTDALVKTFKLSSFSKAENLKLTAATSKYARQTFQAMRPIFADLVQELQRSLGFYSSTHRDAKVEKVVAVGDAFLLPGLQKYLQQNLGLPVELPELPRKAALGENVNAATLKGHFLSAWVAYGLALQGMELTKVNNNLLPTEIAKQVVWRKKRPAFAAAAACLLMAGAMIWFRKTADMRVLAAGSENGGVELNDVVQAVAVINNGPSASLSDREKADTIRAAGVKLGDALKVLNGQGQKERTETQKLLELQRNQTIVARVVEAVHSSVPKPDGPFADAGTAAEFAKAAAEVPRGDRKQLFIDSLNMDYISDLNNPIWQKSLTETEPPINDFSGGSVPGILVKLVCTTPNQGGASFVDTNFLRPIRVNGRMPDAGFYFDRVHIVKGEKVEAGPAGRSGTGAKRPGTPGAKPGGVVAPGGNLDPVTAEPTDEDWRFEIWIDVVLKDYVEPGEKPETPGAGKPSGTEED